MERDTATSYPKTRENPIKSSEGGWSLEDYMEHLAVWQQEQARALARMSSELAEVKGELARIRMNTAEPEKHMTVAEAAKYANTRVQTVYWWINQGLIRASNPPKARTTVRRTELDGLLKANLVGRRKKQEATA